MFLYIVSRRSLFLCKGVCCQYFTKTAFSLTNQIHKNRALLDYVDNKNFIHLYSIDNNSSDKIDDVVKADAIDSKTDNSNESLKEKLISLYKRFKTEYKGYGKLGLTVHFLTYFCWMSLFSALIYSGVDVAALVRKLHLPDVFVDMIANSGLGFLAGAFCLCKIISPVRYVTTLYCTRYAARMMRARGLMGPRTEANRFSSLAKEGRTALSREFNSKKRNDTKSKLHQTSEERFCKKP